jgi:hypothetical protein
VDWAPLGVLLMLQIPVVNSVKALADIVRADLLARGLIPAAEHVVYANGDPGERTTPNQSKLPMVWFWLDKPFAIEVAQTGDPASIAMVATLDEQPVYAQSIGVEKMRARVVMHARLPEEGGTPPPRRGRLSAVTAEEAGTQLRHRVYAAIWRACNGSFRVLAAENYSPTGSEFAWGSASAMIVEVYYHISDDAYPGDGVGALGEQVGEGESVAEVPTDEP